MLPATTPFSEFDLRAALEQRISGAAGNDSHNALPSTETTEHAVLKEQQPIDPSREQYESVLAVRSAVSSRGGTRPVEALSAATATPTETVPETGTPTAIPSHTPTKTAVPTSTPVPTSAPEPEANSTPEDAATSNPVYDATNEPEVADTPTPTQTDAPADVPTPAGTDVPAVSSDPTPSLAPTPLESAPETPQETQESPAPEPAEITGDEVSAIALKYVGYRYAWGGSSPRVGFDCSGFIGYVYQEAGLSVPNHDLYGQLNAGPSVDFDQLQPGDLVFFQNTYTAGLSHGGIYIGGGQFVHAVEEGVGVKVTNIGDEYWASRFVGASRPLENGGQ